MPIATPHHPDGSPVCHPGAWSHAPGTPGVPLVYDRPTEARATLSAVKAWWHPKALDRAKSLPPLGASIHVDGVPALEWQEVPVLGPDGSVVDVRQDWVDVAAQAREAARQAAIERVRSKRSTK